MATYAVFIIESLNSDDYFDGENLHDILELSGIKSIHTWVDSKEEFSRTLAKFKRSGYRYLHLSCHGDGDGIAINGEDIDNRELGRMLAGKITNKRVFFSSCRTSNLKMASALITRVGAQSVIGSPNDFYFSKAALFWPSFYHVISIMDKEKMNRKLLTKVISQCVRLFRVPINYYYRQENKARLGRIKFRFDRKPLVENVKALLPTVKDPH